MRHVAGRRGPVHGLLWLLLRLLLVGMNVMLLLGKRNSAHQTQGSHIELVVTKARRMRLKLIVSKEENKTIKTINSSYKNCKVSEFRLHWCTW